MTAPRFARLDTGTTSVVISCGACPAWAEVRVGRPAAQRVRADHDERVHGIRPANVSGDSGVSDPDLPDNSRISTD